MRDGRRYRDGLGWALKQRHHRAIGGILEATGAGVGGGLGAGMAHHWTGMPGRLASRAAVAAGGNQGGSG
jgi:hypothetical protein